jgi:hypothetical protein
LLGQLWTRDVKATGGHETHEVQLSLQLLEASVIVVRETEEKSAMVRLKFIDEVCALPHGRESSGRDIPQRDAPREFRAWSRHAVVFRATPMRLPNSK